MPASLAELEGRVAALEAVRVDYRAILAAVNALGENQCELTGRLGAVETQLDAIESKVDATNVRVRAMKDNMAEVKDLLVRALER